MITFLVGQRGTGKSSLLSRWQQYAENDLVGFDQNNSENILFFDLDQEIEKGESKTVADIFKEQGESYFRNLEQEYAQRFFFSAKGKNLILSVGGGFQLDSWKDRVRILWCQRVTDDDGRIFFNRPPLDPSLTPLEEFQYRAKKRKILFREAAWEEYLIPEGMNRVTSIEKKILIGEPKDIGGVLTLQPFLFKNKACLEHFFKRRLSWGLKFFELRDDLLDDSMLEWVLKHIPSEKLLWSRRRLSRPNIDFEDKVKSIDYDFQFLSEANPDRPHTVVSLHERDLNRSLYERDLNCSLSEALYKSEQIPSSFHFKLAVEIYSMSELKLGHDWMLSNSVMRSFLPRSQDGRWLWYRLWRGVKQHLNFFREGEGSALDQPSLY